MKSINEIRIPLKDICAMDEKRHETDLVEVLSQSIIESFIRDYGYWPMLHRDIPGGRDCCDYQRSLRAFRTPGASGIVILSF